MVDMLQDLMEKVNNIPEWVDIVSREMETLKRIKKKC